jgi:hypothetical protein
VNTKFFVILPFFVIISLAFGLSSCGVIKTSMAKSVEKTLASMVTPTLTDTSTAEPSSTLRPTSTRKPLSTRKPTSTSTLTPTPWPTFTPTATVVFDTVCELSEGTYVSIDGYLFLGSSVLLFDGRYSIDLTKVRGVPDYQVGLEIIGGSGPNEMEPLYDNYSMYEFMVNANDGTILRQRDFVTVTGVINDKYDTGGCSITVQKVIAGYAWEFSSEGDIEGWLEGSQVSPLQSRNGALITIARGPEPNIFSPRIEANSSNITRLKLRMKVSSGNQAKLLFITDSDTTYDENKSISFPIIADGEFHNYTINLAELDSWDGIVTKIHFYPVDAKTTIEIDSILLTGI